MGNIGLECVFVRGDSEPDEVDKDLEKVIDIIKEWQDDNITRGLVEVLILTDKDEKVLTTLQDSTYVGDGRINNLPYAWVHAAKGGSAHTHQGPNAYFETARVSKIYQFFEDSND